ncbi:hypothetical protein, partial [Neptuniibacter pectenicola]|uniref:hypothetical protein n=1 Tax=Neptuniibacter pectenicola TaxID=1806669 RepID=UPI001E5A61C6
YKSLWMVTFLQRTFTSLVHAHAGRTQKAVADRRCAPSTKLSVKCQGNNEVLINHGIYRCNNSDYGRRV